jgi:hypothetical protein
VSIEHDLLSVLVLTLWVPLLRYLRIVPVIGPTVVAILLTITGAMTHSNCTAVAGSAAASAAVLGIAPAAADAFIVAATAMIVARPWAHCGGLDCCRCRRQ